MRVLLTGASGFVGSHVLDRLVERGISTRVLLRPTSPDQFIRDRLPSVERCEGSVSRPETLGAALRGITHVIHCAGLVRALRIREFHEANEIGTRHLVDAANAAGVRRFVLISSLAAAGPGTPDHPARETDPPRPVSEYGRSKLAGERQVEQHGRFDFVILRPPAVYGPRDREFLRLFKAVKMGWLPDVGCGRQALSLVYVEDLARVIVECLTPAAAAGRTFFVAHPEVRTARAFGECVAREVGSRPIRLLIPVPLLWPVCWAQDLISQLTRTPNVLSRQKFAELRAPGWVCEGARLRDELGLACQTSLPEGVRRTAAAYRALGWL